MSHCHPCNGRGGCFLRALLDECCSTIANNSCGSEPARDSGGSAHNDVGYAAVIASRLAPTGVAVRRKKAAAPEGSSGFFRRTA
ncbi:hypothetical protein CRX69_24040 [Pseudomonas rhizophila]|uniref:Uncharacterized protein n=1 Tax=Pseudomonas rhizophila TaxID=2045200 RepID=A0ABM6UKI9_9PSED|nr:hypothetical protein CRX69_24040 [Pseudomonas rhizophila]